MINQKYIYICFLVIAISFGRCKQYNPNAQQDKVQKILSQIQEPEFPDTTFNIVNYGGVGDGITLNTEFINYTINECAKNGGGTVLIPPGVFLTGAIQLENNVNLKIDKGAELRFSIDPKDYLPLIKTSWEGIQCFNYSPLIYAIHKKNIAVTGTGILNGDASSQDWWIWKGRVEYGWKSGIPSQVDNANRPQLDVFNQNRTPYEKRLMGEGRYLRPQFIQFYECENILIENVHVKNAPFWIIHPVYSQSITIRGVEINSLGPNNDGCDPESCKNVLIENCIFNTGDDCIALKSGRDEDGREINKPIENVVIRNCQMKNGHGGVVIGSEISGGVKNIFVENCKMSSPELDQAIRIKTNNNRGGITDSIFIKNITVGEVKESVIRINCAYDQSEGQGTFPPLIKNVFISEIKSEKAKYVLFLQGLKDISSIENIYIENSTFQGVEEKNRIENVKNVNFKNVKINGELVSS